MPNCKIIHSDCLDAMKGMEDNSIDFIVTDPPYGLHFMGKNWDEFNRTIYKEQNETDFKKKGGAGNVIQNANSAAGSYDERLNDKFQEFMRKVGIEMLRILKPGGMLAMFGASRRHHRQMSGLEDAGFEIRDCIAWIFGQGFPKSHNFGRKLGDKWNGYGTALKPAYEPIIIAMKPLNGTFANNAEKWGVGGINIDGCRIGIEKRSYTGGTKLMEKRPWNDAQVERPKINVEGRWPANLILDEESAEQLDQMTGNLGKSPKIGAVFKQKRKESVLSETKGMYSEGREFSAVDSYGYGDSGGASRFFYCAKASSSERNRGLEGMPLKEARPLGISNWEGQTNGSGEVMGKSAPKANSHPTVKPISLMKYIITLLAPPGSPILLDPFCGSGSTLIAAKELGISAIGIEKEKEYVEIATKRLDAAQCTSKKQMEMF